MALADGLYRELPGLRPERDQALYARFRALRQSRVWTRALATAPRRPVPWLPLLLLILLPALAWTIVQQELARRGILPQGEWRTSLIALCLWSSGCARFLRRRQPPIETMAARIEGVRYPEGDAARSLTLLLDDGRTVFLLDRTARGKVGDVGVVQFAGDELHRFLRAG